MCVKQFDIAFKRVILVLLLNRYFPFSMIAFLSLYVIVSCEGTNK